MVTASKLDEKTVLEMYKTMLTIRRFEEQARREADAGKLRGMHSAIGQEAVPTGICVHLRDGDYIFGTHRSHHHCIAKGLDIKLMMAELLGKATGTNKGKGGTMHIADINKGMLGANGIVGSNIPVATGAALTAQVKGTDLVSIVFFGDGAANQGVLHESMNLAGIWNLPVIFVSENNRYAQSTPFEYSVSGESVADRAAGYGMPGITVDGQSVLDVYEVAGESINRARSGGGPTLIEAKTYRYMGHFGADNPLMYRTQEEEEEFKARDCNQHLMNYILDHNIATQENLDELDQKVIAEVAEAAKFANDSPYPEPSELTTDVYVSY